MIKGRDIICISPSYWDGIWGTAQQFMDLFSRDNRVLYVEPPPPYRYLVKHPEHWSKIFAFRRGLIKPDADKNLWITVVPPTPPFKYQINLMDRADEKMSIMWISRAARALEFTNPILWLILPTSVNLSGKLEEFLVYHCFDEFAAVPGRQSARIEKDELKLMERADLVITCSENVYEAKAPFCKEIINIPNGVDFDRFNKALDESFPIAAELKNISAGPVIGYSGSVDYRLDEELLAEAAKRYQDYTFVFVGPVARKFSKLNSLANVKMLGPRPRMEIPSYIKGFDVCMVPYEKNEFCMNASPLKVFEYLAAGKPVVASDIRAMDDLADVVYIGRNQEEIIDLIPVAVESNKEEAVEARVDRAKNNTWQNCVDIASKKIAELNDLSK